MYSNHCDVKSPMTIAVEHLIFTVRYLIADREFDHIGAEIIFFLHIGIGLYTFFHNDRQLL